MLRYLFLDMNSFFASVEQQEQPELRGRPVAVAPTLVRTTCCIAASYEAKAYGVKTGTAVHDALDLCPGLRVVEARPDLYVRYHHRIVAAVESCLHVDRVCSIDEMVGRLLGPERQPEQAAALAHRVKATLRRQVGECLRCSVGLAPNAWLAKVAAEMQKPDGLTMIRAEQLPEALHKLALTDLPGIARPTEARLHRHGVFHVHQLCQLSLAAISAAMGSRVMGLIWWSQLRAHDLPFPATHRRCVGHSHVLPPAWRTPQGACAVLTRLIHRAAARLRRMAYWARRLHVSVQYLEGPYWERRLDVGLCRDTLTLVEAFGRCRASLPPGRPYTVGVVLSDLVADPGATRPLFPDQCRRDALANAMDRIERRFGHHAVYFGGMFGAQKTAPVRISFTQIPRLDEFS